MSNRYSERSEEQLIDSGADPAAAMEMTRRLKLAIESQTRAIEDFNTKAGRQTTSGGLGWQIYLALGASE